MTRPITPVAVAVAMQRAPSGVRGRGAGLSRLAGDGLPLALPKIPPFVCVPLLAGLTTDLPFCEKAYRFTADQTDFTVTAAGEFCDGAVSWQTIYDTGGVLFDETPTPGTTSNILAFHRDASTPLIPAGSSIYVGVLLNGRALGDPLVLLRDQDPVYTDTVYVDGAPAPTTSVTYRAPLQASPQPLGPAPHRIELRNTIGCATVTMNFGIAPFFFPIFASGVGSWSLTLDGATFTAAWDLTGRDEHPWFTVAQSGEFSPTNVSFEVDISINGSPPDVFQIIWTKPQP